MKRSLALVLVLLSLGSPAFAEPSDSLVLSGDHTAGALAFGTADEASGTAHASVPLEFPPGRRGALPRLSLSYRHTGGPSEVGEGWSLGLPVIERRGIAGSSAPTFGADDQFYYAGQRLTKVGTVPSQTPGEVVPSWASGWVLYRPMVERGHTRVFQAGNTWRVVLPDGGLYEFGVPAIVTGTNDSLDLDRCNTAQVVRWKLVLESDSDVVTNPVVYRWARTSQGGVADCARPSLLTDVYYTHSPSAGLASLDSYANHVQFNYVPVTVAPPANQPSPAGLRATSRLHLERIGIASRQAATGSRERVRSYRFDYMPMRGGRPFLKHVTLVGRCAPGGASVEWPSKPAVGLDTYALPDDRDCAARPPWEFTYSEDHAVQPVYSGGAVVGTRFLPDGSSAATPYEAPYGNVTLLGENGLFDEELEFDHLDISDVNRDGFPDIVNSAQRRVLLARGPLGAFEGGAITYGAVPLDNASSGPPAFSTTARELIFWKDRVALTVPGSWTTGRATQFLSRADGATQEIQEGLPRRLLQVEGTGSPSFQLREVQSNFAAPGATGSPHAFGDIDGDGLPDALTKAPYSQSMWANLSLRTTTAIAGLGTSKATNLVMGDAPALYSTLVDMNGDGYADYVTYDHQGWFYYPGRGDGTFGCTANASPCVAIDNVFDGHTHGAHAPGTYGLRLTGVQLIASQLFADITGDGRADLINVNIAANGWVTVQVNLDGLTFAPAIDIPFSAPLNPEVRRSLTTDINASGVTDVVVLGRHSGIAVDLQHNGMPGLLTRARSPEGATTDYEYDTVQREATRYGEWGGGLVGQNDPEAVGPWKNTSPVPAYVVKKITTSSGAVAPYARASTTTFDYHDAVFDTWRSELRGFRRTRATTGTGVVETRYIFGGCLTKDGESPSATAPLEERCTTADVDPYDALNGSPFQIERYATSISYEGEVHLLGTHLSTTFTTHNVQQVATRRWYAFPSETNTFLFDPSSPATPSSKDLPRSNFTVDGSTSSKSWTIQLQGTPCTSEQDTTGCLVRLRERSEVQVPSLISRKYFDGRVALDDSPIDRPIKVDYGYVTLSQPGIYRLASQQVTFAGQGLVPSIGPDAPAKVTLFEWDARGRLKKVSAVAGGALALQRFHETGQAVAPEPVNAVTPGMTGAIPLQTFGYDEPTGNLWRVIGAEGECFDPTFDPSYADPG